MPLFAKEKPNILLMLADDLGYADLGCQGSPEVKTPHIDSIAKGGVRFTAGYVNGTYCSPSRAALMSGLYPQRFGYEYNPDEVKPHPAERVIPDGPGLPVKVKILPEYLKMLGYRNGLVGKWHLGESGRQLPLQRGFDEALHFPDYGKQPPVNAFRNGDPVKLDDWAIDAMKQQSVSFIERHHDVPWFLFLSFTETHGALRPKPDVLRRFMHIKDRSRRALLAAAASMDDCIGAVLETIQRLNLEEDTLIVFLSDNGGSERQNFSLNTPFRAGKGSTYEGGIRIPFLMKWKGHLQEGMTYIEPVIAADIVPTIMAAAGSTATTAVALDGVNLWPHLKGEKNAPPHEILFWRFQPFWAVRAVEWKLVKAPPENPRPRDLLPTLPLTIDGASLFNLAEDPSESKDLSAQHLERVQQLWSAWRAWNEGGEPPHWLPDNEQRLKRLRKAGGSLGESVHGAQPGGNSLNR